MSSSASIASPSLLSDDRDSGVLLSGSSPRLPTVAEFQHSLADARMASEATGPVGYRMFPPCDRPALLATRGLATAAVWLIWTAAALAVASAVALRVRLFAIDDVAAGSGSASSIAFLDTVVDRLALVESLVAVAAISAVMIWTFRIVRNAEAISRRRIGVKAATFGWLMAIGTLWIPFVLLRRAAIVARRARVVVSFWQAGWVAVVLVGLAMTMLDQPATRAAFATEANVAVLIAVFTLVAAFFAQSAIRHLDAGIAERASSN